MVAESQLLVNLREITVVQVSWVCHTAQTDRLPPPGWGDAPHQSPGNGGVVRLSRSWWYLLVCRLRVLPPTQTVVGTRTRTAVGTLTRTAVGTLSG